MIIPINEQYRIASGTCQWIVQKKRSRKGKDAWSSQTYHVTFEAALTSLAHNLVRDSKAASLSAALAEIENITTTLSQALTPNSYEVSDIEKARGE